MTDTRETAGPVGVGLGLRWEFLEEVLDGPKLDVAFWEVSPENYMRRGGYYPAALERIRERYPVITHGLTMSFGAIEPPPPDYLAELRREIERLGSPWHTDHLCFSTAGPRVLHDLLPLKQARENVERVADRLRAVQDVLGVPTGFENISWYAHPGRAELSEADFINGILERADCRMLLDVNNIWVNAQNHGFDPYELVDSIAPERVLQIHVAGHTFVDDLDMIIDTHGAPVADPVYDLLEHTLRRTGPVPVLLERDNHVPELDELLAEVARLRAVYDRAMADRNMAAQADAAARKQEAR